MTQDAILTLARRYIWWQPPEESAQNPDRVPVQVMDIGTLEDCKKILADAGADHLKRILQNARPGQLRPKAWNFWHIVLDLAATPAAIPMLPTRRMP